MSKETSSLIKVATANPYRFFSVAEVGEMFGFGRNTMTAIINLGAPIVARKMNPDLFKSWLGANADILGKISEQ